MEDKEGIGAGGHGTHEDMADKRGKMNLVHILIEAIPKGQYTRTEIALAGAELAKQHLKHMNWEDKGCPPMPEYTDLYDDTGWPSDQ